MAPALTEAAGQAQKLKLPFAPPPSSRRFNSSSNRRGGLVDHREEIQEDDGSLVEEEELRVRGGGEEEDELVVVVDQEKLEKSFLLLPTVEEVGFNNNNTNQKRKQQQQQQKELIGDERSELKSKFKKRRTSSSDSMTTDLCCSQCTMNGEHGEESAAAATEKAGTTTTTKVVEDGVDCHHQKKKTSNQEEINTTTMGSVIKTGTTSDTANLATTIEKNQVPSSQPQLQLDCSSTFNIAAEIKRRSLLLAEKTAARERFQANVERRAERLLRRMCKLRAIQASQHVSRQLVEFVDYQRKSLQLPTSSSSRSEQFEELLNISNSSNRTSSNKIINCSSTSTSSNNGVDVMKGTSSSSIMNLLNRLESSHNSNLSVKQQNVLLDYVQRCSGQLSMTTTMTGKLDSDTCDKIERTCGSLLTNIGYLDREIDSDATASSSGGESCDEAEVYDDRKFKAIPIQKRAFWKWAMDRAAVVSRWSWIQAQVSDLEYRIRQTSELHRHIRRMKDSPFGDKSLSASSSSSSLASQVNGFVVLNHESSTCETSCRTCPLKPIRKRKLLRTGGLYKTCRKAAKLSTVRCGCEHPSSHCVICCGRANCIQSSNVDAMPLKERVALLDPSFHPVLSFARDISLSIHFEHILRNDEHGKCPSKQRNVSAVKKKPRPLQINDHARKQSRKLKRNATVTLTAKLRKKINNDQHLTGGRARNSGNRHCRLRKRTKQISTSSSKHSRERSFSGSSGCCSKAGSPVPSPEVGDNSSSQASGNSSWGSTDPRDHRRGSMLHDILRRRRGESEFDINNIVIPYSMAASTRVEILQYKEILTPKWRAIEDNFVNNGASVCDVLDDEDISDEAIVRRHERCEHTEKKRFLGFMKKPGLGVRRARSMRSDSRADSSGANTPDPMSPHTVEPHDSPLTTPPSTPAPVITSATVVEEQQHQHQPLSLSQRRRTTSLSKRDRILDDIRVATPSENILYEHVPVPPWDQRTFPLGDQLYEQMVQESVSSELEDSFDVACNSVPENEWNDGVSAGGGDAMTTTTSTGEVGPSYEEPPPNLDWSVTPIGITNDLVVK